MTKKNNQVEKVVMAEKALVKIEALAIQQIDTEAVVSSLRESGLTGFNPFSFDQIRVPGAGSLAFTVKTEDGEEPMKNLDVVILHFHKTRQYYSQPYDAKNPQNAPPECVSYDGAVGQGDPGGACGLCPLGKFQGGCNPGYFVYLLFPDGTMPVKLNVPRTSISVFEAYFTKVGMSGKYVNQVITRIGLEKRKKGEGMVLTFKLLYSLPTAVAESSRGYAKMISTSLAYPGLDDEMEDPTTKRIAAPVERTGLLPGDDNFDAGDDEDVPY